MPNEFTTATLAFGARAKRRGGFLSFGATRPFIPHSEFRIDRRRSFSFADAPFRMTIGSGKCPKRSTHLPICHSERSRRIADYPEPQGDFAPFPSVARRERGIVCRRSRERGFLKTLIAQSALPLCAITARSKLLTRFG